MVHTDMYAWLDPEYFEFLEEDSMGVTVQSRNTGHCWYLLLIRFRKRDKVVIFHKHKMEDPFHFQCNAGSVESSVWKIMKHDLFQLNGRRSVERSVWKRQKRFIVYNRRLKNA